MESNNSAAQRVDERGPRYVVQGQIRPGERASEYADTAEQAEKIRKRYVETGYYQVHVYPPEGSVDLASLGAARQKATDVLNEATATLRAGVLRALEAGRSEVEVARTAGVDRMTVRAWAGK